MAAPWGLDPNVVHGRSLTAADIDDVLGGRPALVRLFDGHSALASSGALRVAGVDGPVAFDQRSELVCEADGTPTGLLLETAAIALVDSAAPTPTVEEHAVRTHEALSRMAALGITAAHALEHAPQASAVYLIEAERELPVRLCCSPWAQPGAPGRAGRRFDHAHRVRGCDHPRVTGRCGRELITVAALTSPTRGDAPVRSTVRCGPARVARGRRRTHRALDDARRAGRGGKGDAFIRWWLMVTA